MQSIQVMLSSKLARRQAQEYVFQISPPIPIDPDKDYYISVKRASIPYSFYQISSQNNSLRYSIGGIEQAPLILPPGNYSVVTLVTFLNALGSTLTFSYAGFNNKITITAATNFILLSTSSAMALLGFSEGVDHSSVANALISDNVVNIINTTSIKVNTNLIVDTRDSGNSSNTLVVVPVNRQPNAMLEGSQDFQTRLFASSDINNIQVSLYNQDDEAIDMNGVNFEILLIISMRD